MASLCLLVFICVLCFKKRTQRLQLFLITPQTQPHFFRASSKGFAFAPASPCEEAPSLSDRRSIITLISILVVVAGMIIIFIMIIIADRSIIRIAVVAGMIIIFIMITISNRSISPSSLIIIFIVHIIIIIIFRLPWLRRLRAPSKPFVIVLAACGARA